MPMLLYWEFKKIRYFSKSRFMLNALSRKSAVSEKQFLFQLHMVILNLFRMGSPMTIPDKIEREG